MKRQEVIFITGMHRSGTSLFSNIFTHLGYVHGDNLLPANEFNYFGYWEDGDLIAFNNKLLEAAGMTWDSVHFINFEEEDTNYWISFEEEAKELILQKMGHAKGFVFKDPRLCMLLTFWYKILNELAIPCKTILLYRNPEEVRLSLERRNEFHYGKTDLLFCIYYANAIQQIQNGKAFFVFLEDIIQNNEVVIQELTNYLKIDVNKFNEVISSSGLIKPRLLIRKFRSKEPQSENKNLTLTEEVFRVLHECKGTFTATKIPSVQFQTWKQIAVKSQSVLAYVQYNDYKLNTVPKSQERVAQLFFGNHEADFSEEQSVISSINRQPLTFLIPENVSIDKLRFDPLNDFVFVRIKDIRILRKGNEKELKYSLRSNAILEEDGTYLFDSVDSQMYLDFQDADLTGGDSVQIWMEYLSVGAEAQYMALELYKKRWESIKTKLEISLLEDEKRHVLMKQMHEQNASLSMANEFLTIETEKLRRHSEMLAEENNYYKNWWKFKLKKLIGLLKYLYKFL